MSTKISQRLIFPLPNVKKLRCGHPFCMAIDEVAHELESELMEAIDGMRWDARKSNRLHFY